MKNRKEIRIVDYKPRYAKETVKVWRESYEKALRINSQHTFEEQLEFLQKKLVTNNKVYLAIDWDFDKVVGMMAMNQTELNQLYIHVGYQKTGIGSRFLQIAKTLSPQKLQLYTFAVNQGAQTFYEKHGFTAIGYGNNNEENLPDIRYEWTGK